MASGNLSSGVRYNDTDLNSTLVEAGANFHTIVTQVVSVLFAFTTALGLFGNILVILVIAFNVKNMRSSTNFLVLNLAVADLSFIIICVPFTAVKYSTLWMFGDIWCKIVNYMSYVCSWASAYTLVLMSVDRFIAVVFAVRCRSLRSKRNTVIAIIFTWLVVYLVNIPALLFHGELSYEQRNGSTLKTCSYLTGQIDIRSTLTFHFSNFTFGFALPVITIAILYSILIAFLMRRQTTGGNSSATAKTTKRVTIMVILVIVVFIVCWLPLQVILVMTYLNKYPLSKGTVILQICANCLAYMNSCMNPLLYTISSTAFREAFKEFLCCKARFMKSLCSRANRDRNDALKVSQTPTATATTELYCVSAQQLDIHEEERVSFLSVPDERLVIATDTH